MALGEALGTLPAATLSASAGTPANSQHESGLPGCSEEACSLQEQEIGFEAESQDAEDLYGESRREITGSLKDFLWANFRRYYVHQEGSMWGAVCIHSLSL